VGFKQLFEEAAHGDKTALAIRDRCLRVWAADAVALVHAYDPEVIVIGGGVMESANIIIPHVESHVHKYAWTPWGKVRIRPAEIGEQCRTGRGCSAAIREDLDTLAGTPVDFTARTSQNWHKRFGSLRYTASMLFLKSRS
jgi:predicted NBD/HSP70 family sugar kinase